MLIGRTDVEVETPMLWPPDAKNYLIGEVPDAGKDWKQEEKGTTEDEMVGSATRWTWVIIMYFNTFFPTLYHFNFLLINTNKLLIMYQVL